MVASSFCNDKKAAFRLENLHCILGGSKLLNSILYPHRGGGCNFLDHSWNDSFKESPHKSQFSKVKQVRGKIFKRKIHSKRAILKNEIRLYYQ